MAHEILTNLDFKNISKITNLPNGVDAGDAVNVGQLNAAVEGLAWKDSVRVATTGNISLASPGATIDGITMASGDRFLVKNQTASKENGIYIWNGAAVPATRALDANTADELEAAVVSVEEGTSAGASFRQTQVNFVLETGNVVWTSFGTSAAAATETTSGVAEIATQAETDTGTDDQRIVTPAKLANWSGRTRKFSQDIGDGSATSYTVTHNLNTRDVRVEVFRNSGNYDTVLAEVRRTSVNAVQVVFSVAPTSNQFRVVVTG